MRVKMKLGLREARSAGVFDAPSCALHRRSEINGQEGSGLFWPRRALLLGRNPGPGPGPGGWAMGSWAGSAGARAREAGHGSHFAGLRALLLDQAKMAKQIVQSQFFDFLIFQKTI